MKTIKKYEILWANRVEDFVKLKDVLGLIDELHKPNQNAFVRATLNKLKARITGTSEKTTKAKLNLKSLSANTRRKR